MKWATKIQDAVALIVHHLLTIASTTNIEFMEVLNAYQFYCWLRPLTFQPDYLHSSPYLQVIANSFSRLTCACVAWSFFIAQVVCIIFAAFAPFLLHTKLTMYTWVYIRGGVLLLSSFIWFMLANLQNQVRAGGVGENLWTGCAIVCLWGVVKIGVNSKADKKYKEQEPIKGQHLAEIRV